jgi:addiction module RelE/StbE family toxin
MYKLLFLSQVKKDYKKLDKKVASMIREKYLPRIKKNPYAGEMLKGELNGFFSYHFRHGKVDYRIAYRIQVNDHIVQIFKIGKRENFYRDLGNRFD